jgi:hypothetical protein
MILNKREFITGAIALTGGALASDVLASDADPRDPLGCSASPVTAVLYDERYGDARAFAAALADRGATAHRTGQDVIAVWYRAVRGLASQPGARIAGLTPQSDLALLQGCAAELRLKLLYEGLHDRRRTAGLVHSVRARGALANAAVRGLCSAQTEWPGALAQVLTRAASRGEWSAWLDVVRPGMGPAADHPGTLATWMIGITG